jgi:3-methylfumaryl-CoA hydratase
MTSACPSPSDLAACVGRSEISHDVADARSVARLAALLDRERAPVAGDALPPLWHWIFFAPVIRPRDTGDDGHPRTGAFLPRVDGARRLWAGSRVQFLAPLRVGAALQRRTTILDAQEKRGGELVLVTLRHQIEADGQLCIHEEQDLAYRRGAAASAPAEVRAPGERSLGFTPDSLLLFRYSALTGNAHRIHYDRDYATRDEGYPGLVVHAPLTATLLLEFRYLLDAPPVASLSLRARRPLFEGAPVTLHAQRAEGGWSLWAIGPDGGVALSMETADA